MSATNNLSSLHRAHRSTQSLRRSLGGFVGAIFISVSPAVCAQFTPPQEGLIGWWAGEGNGNDSAGTNNGTLNGVAFSSGMFGQAFSFGGNFNRVLVPDNAQFILTNSLSIGAWIYPTADSWVVLMRNGGPFTPYSFQLDDAGHFQFYIKNAAGTQDQLSAPVSYNQWYQVTATLNGANGDMRLYTNGSLAAQKFTIVKPLGNIDSSYQPTISIGNTPGGTFPFIGLVDEVVLYSRALSPCEVTTLALSSNIPPCIAVQPRSQVAYYGASVSMSVTALGTAPLVFLWSKDTFPISWATNSTLILTNLQSTDAADYSVVVTNGFGNATSASAHLVVNPVGVSLGIYPGVTIEGAVGKNYGIQYATNVSSTSVWTTLTNFSLTQPVQQWFDSADNLSAGYIPQRFYRVVVLP